MGDDGQRPTKRRKTKPNTTPTDKESAPQSGFHCNHCRKDITHVVRIKCAECVDFDLCVECFSVGAEAAEHKAFHKYRVMDRMDYPILEKAWQASEELMLLEAIEQHGYGNWADIAEYVGTKSKIECCAHYEECYLRNKDSLPVTDNILPGGESLVRWRKAHPNSWVHQIEDSGNKPKKKEKSKTTKPGDQKSTTAAELAGYYKLREDFDTEWDNDAEKLIMSMAFDDEEEDPLERKLKLTLLEIYNGKLNERMERKQFSFDRELVDAKKGNPKRTKEEKELHNKMSVFARHHSAEEHDHLMDGLNAELKIRQRIERLQEARTMGISSLPDADVYEAEKKKRETEKIMKKARATYLYNEPRGSQRSQRWLNRDREDGGIITPRIGEPLDISAYPGIELLCTSEADVCSVLHVPPTVYFQVKGVLTRECFAQGYITKKTAKQLVQMESPGTVEKLYEFFTLNGWITSDPRAQHRFPLGVGGRAPKLPVCPSSGVP